MMAANEGATTTAAAVVNDVDLAPKTIANDCVIKLEPVTTAQCEASTSNGDQSSTSATHVVEIKEEPQQTETELKREAETANENDDPNAAPDLYVEPPSPPLPVGFRSQKEHLLRFRAPKRNGQQIVRYPISLTRSSASTEQFDPTQHYVEICVNRRSSSDKSNRKKREGCESTSQAYSDSDDDDFIDYADFDQFEDDEPCESTEPDDLDEAESAKVMQLIQSIVEQRLMLIETPEQRQMRIERKREKMRRYYAAESDEQRRKRLQKARDYKRKQKMRLEKVETPEQRIERLRKQRERQRRFYARETNEQRRRRLDKVREYQRRRKEDKFGFSGNSSGGDEMNLGNRHRDDALAAQDPVSAGSSSSILNGN